jgi:zinc protease
MIANPRFRMIVSILVGWTTTRDDEPALSALNSILSGPGGVLEQQLVNKGIASSAWCNFWPRRVDSLFACTVTAATERSAADVERALDSVLSELRSNGPTAQALNGAVASDAAKLLHHMAALEDRASSLSSFRFLYGDASYWTRLLDLEKKLTAEAVRAAATHWLDPRHRVVVIVRPPLPGEEPARRSEPPAVHAVSSRVPAWRDPEPWRKTMPPLAAAPPSESPPVQRLVLTNGMPVYVIENHALPLVTVDFLSVGGNGVNPDGKASAQLVAKLLPRGAGTRDTVELAAALRAQGATLTSVSSSDKLTLQLASLRDQLEPALDLLADVVERPRLDAHELERMRGQLRDETKQWLNNGRATARIALRQLLFGKAHPYGRENLPGDVAIQKTSLNDIKAYLARYVHPGNSALLVAGDVTPEVALRLIAARFGTWANSAAAIVAPEPAAVPPSRGQRIVLLERPGAAQVNLFAGRIVPPRASNDWDGGDLATEILAGTYTARLNENLRVRRAITYVARGYLQPRRGPSYVELFADVPLPSAPLALGELLREVAGIVTRPPDEAETRLARRQMQREMAEAFATNDDAVAALANIVLYRLPLDYYATRPARLDLLRADELAAATKRYLEATMTVVVVGPPSLAEALEQAGLGPVERQTIETLIR